MKTHDFDINQLDYWTEEVLVPLFVVSDPRQAPFVDDFLVIAKNNTSTFYFLNQRLAQEVKLGIQQFGDKKSLDKYEQEVDAILTEFKQIDSHDDDLMLLLDFLQHFNQVYIQTEDFRTAWFEKSFAVEEATIEQLASMRYKMRENFESVFFQAMGRAMEKLAKKNTLIVNDLDFYDFTELQQLAEEGVKVDRATIQARAQGYVFWRNQEQSRTMTGKEFETTHNLIESKMMIDETSELKGSSANKGVVQGKVQLILHDRFDMGEQVKNFVPGSILVTEMTRPQTMTACQSAKAIVTDEGGIISHAAILAREFNIPCIVGTKFATKRLKNGDEVIVDANQGIVTKVK